MQDQAGEISVRFHTKSNNWLGLDIFGAGYLAATTEARLATQSISLDFVSCCQSMFCSVQSSSDTEDGIPSDGSS